MASGKIGETSKPVVPVESNGTVFSCKSSAQMAPHSTGTMATSLRENPLSMDVRRFVPTMGSTAPFAPARLTVPDFASNIISSVQKNHLPEWKPSHYNGDPL